MSYSPRPTRPLTGLIMEFSSCDIIVSCLLWRIVGSVASAAIVGLMLSLTSLFWAINRSYDALFKTSLLTARGFAHNVDFRGKVNDRTDFDVALYGVNDRGKDNSPAAKQTSPSCLERYFWQAAVIFFLAAGELSLSVK